MSVIKTFIFWHRLWKAVSGKKSRKKVPPWAVRGRVRVRLGIGLGLGYGKLFSRGDFFLEPATALNWTCCFFCSRFFLCSFVIQGNARLIKGILAIFEKCHDHSPFRTQLNICAVFSSLLFSQKVYIIDIWLGF